MVKSNFGIFDKEKVFDDENSTLKLLLYHEDKILDKVENIMFQWSSSCREAKIRYLILHLNGQEMYIDLEWTS